MQSGGTPKGRRRCIRYGRLDSWSGQKWHQGLSSHTQNSTSKHTTVPR